jgi:phage-related tail fiber protein
MNRQTVAIVVSSLIGATAINATMLSCGEVETEAVAGAAPLDVPAGSIVAYAGRRPPIGWLLCDGAELARDSYVTLFEAIGTTYGAGNGQSTFNLPDLRGRTVIGAGQGPGLPRHALGETGGEGRYAAAGDGMPGGATLPFIALSYIIKI